MVGFRVELIEFSNEFDVELKGQVSRKPIDFSFLGFGDRTQGFSLARQVLLH